MLKHGLCIVMVVLLCGVSYVPLIAADEEELSPLAQKAKAIVEAAYEYVSEHSDDMEAVQKALEEDPRFRDDENELYVFIGCYDVEKKEVLNCGHGMRPQLFGQDMSNLRTPNGRLLMQEFTEMIEKDGNGWMEYDWLNEYHNTIQTKQSYLMKIILKDGRKAWMGCGFWKE